MQRVASRASRIAIVIALATAACSSDPAGDSGGAGGEGGAAPGVCPTTSHVGAGDADCDAGEGGPMRRIPLPGGGTMCIDLTEVTVGAYQKFVDAGVVVTLDDADPALARCAAKTSYAAPCEDAPCKGAGCDLPQNCVDQCDAKLYCRWAGKRLCGAIGAAPLALGDVNDPAKNQWMNACTAGGGSTWPYGATYDPLACNTVDETPAACNGPAIVSSYADCHAPAGPYDGVFDLSGNLSEWVDASQEGADWPEQRCVIMGGSYVHYLGDVSCAGATLEWPCNSGNPEFGFRCCSL